MFRTSVHCLIYFSTCHGLKTWLELPRLKLCRDDPKENKNYVESAGGSSYRGFEQPRVKLQWKYESRNREEIDYGSSLREVPAS